MFRPEPNGEWQLEVSIASKRSNASSGENLNTDIVTREQVPANQRRNASSGENLNYWDTVAAWANIETVASERELWREFPTAVTSAGTQAPARIST